ncbi:hypothetical protein NIES4073_73830 [Kalymmatonema gypsitolerans NIES-4073]|nr:hypothetical protein NIES4073_73830 [Scytonema sp. NIES-4073]
MVISPALPCPEVLESILVLFKDTDPVADKITDPASPTLDEVLIFPT